MSKLLHPPIFRAFDGNGDISPGAKLYFYETDTSTPKPVYSDADLSAPITQPVVADSTGRFVAIYLSDSTYKVVLTDSDDAEIWTVDPYPIDSVASLTSQVSTNTADIATLDGKMATAESDIETLQTESLDYESRIAANETAIGVIESTGGYFHNVTLSNIPYSGGSEATIWNAPAKAGSFMVTFMCDIDPGGAGTIAGELFIEGASVDLRQNQVTTDHAGGRSLSLMYAGAYTSSQAVDIRVDNNSPSSMQAFKRCRVCLIAV